MKVLSAILSEIWGLFVEDGRFALAIVAIVAVAAVLAFALHAPSLLTGAFIVIASLAALIASTLSVARKL